MRRHQGIEVLFCAPSDQVVPGTEPLRCNIVVVLRNFLKAILLIGLRKVIQPMAVGHRKCCGWRNLVRRLLRSSSVMLEVVEHVQVIPDKIPTRLYIVTFVLEALRLAAFRVEDVCNSLNIWMKFFNIGKGS